MAGFRYSQSSVKDLEKDTTCPTRWKAQWLDRIIPFQTNEHMDKGKYFEQLFLGASAIESDLVTDLPRLQSGGKSADHIRIDQQAANAKRLFDPTDPEFLGYTITDSQLKLTAGDTIGTLDIVAVDKDYATWVIDVKLTKDLSNSYSEYGWGNDWETLDLLQQVHYDALFRTNFPNLDEPKSALLVFDYTPKKRIDFGEIVISDQKRKEKDMRFDAARDTVSLYQENGWTKVPSKSECENCPLQCDRRANTAIVNKRIINY